MTPPETLPETLHRAARDAPQRGVSFVDPRLGDSFVSWGGLESEARVATAGLRAAGCVSGTPVIVATAAAHDTLTVLWGALLAGSIPLTVRSPAHATDLAAVRLRAAWEMLGRPLVVGEPRGVATALGPQARVLSPEDCVAGGEVPGAPTAAQTAGNGPAPSRDDVALLVLTSGTEGPPKLVAHTHAGVLTALAGSAQATGLDEHDVSFNWLPLHHVGALFRAFRDVWLRCRSIQAPTAGVAAEPRTWMNLCASHGATTTWGPNFALGLLADGMTGSPRLELDRLRSLLTTGEVVVPATLRRLVAALEPHGFDPRGVHATWGMTEAWSATVSLEVMARLPDSGPVDLGPAVPGTALRIVDDGGRPVPDGEPGRLEVSGPACAAGLWRDGRLDRSSFTTDGWLRTGDLGVLRSGRLSVTGREDDSVSVNGVRHSCHDLEALAAQVEGVGRDGVVVCPLRLGGDTEEIAVFVLGDAGESVAASIRERLAVDAGLASVHVLPVAREAVPRTALGKVRRAELARVARSRIAAGPASRPGTTTAALPPPGGAASDHIEAVAAVLARVLDVARIGPDDNIFALGAGSLHVLRAAAALQALEPDTPVTPLDLFAHPTPRQFAARLRGVEARRSAALDGTARGRTRLARRPQADARRRARNAPGTRPR